MSVPDLPRLTGLRIGAALVVLAFHLGTHTGWLAAPGLVRYGYTGVGFFFVLSGFVLTWSFRAGEPRRHFYLRRVARVYPSHLVMALAAVVVPVTVFAVNDKRTAANLLLLQSWVPDPAVIFSLNGVSWSLSCEAFFYLVAPVLIPLAARGRRTPTVVLCLAWVVACAVVTVVVGGHGGNAGLVAFSNPLLRSGDFVLGVLLGTLVAQGWRPRVPLPAAYAVLAVVLVGLTLAPGTLAPAVGGAVVTPFAALVVLAAALADASGRRSVLLHRPWVQYAGRASFALYLVHELAIVNLVPVLGFDGSPLGDAARVAGTVWVCGLLAVALHELVERPAQRWLLRLGLPRRPVRDGAVPARPRSA